MSFLDSVRRGPSTEPLRILLHGVEGIGKTTFAAKIPNALFLAPEDGGGDLDFARVAVDSWAQAQSIVAQLTAEPHEFRTLVIDTIDFLERLCWQHLMKEAGVESIEGVGGGFGKGYVAACDEQTRFVKALDGLRASRRMHIVCLAHTEVKAYKNPEGADYDRYQIRMDRRASALWAGWCDAILFANYDVQVKTEKSGDAAMLKRGKVKNRESDRVLYTQPRPAFDAKNRYGLDAELDLDWGAFSAAIRWDERDRAVLGKASALGAPTLDEMRDAVKNALRNLDWTNEDVAALLAQHNASKLADLADSDRGVVLATLSNPKQPIAAK